MTASLQATRQSYLIQVQLEKIRREKERRAIAGTMGQPQEAKLTFSQKYWDSPDQFALDCFNWKEGEGPTPYQLEILVGLIVRKRIAVRGPHSLGKTSENAWIVLWFALTRDMACVDWKLPYTAGAWRQLTKFSWPEIHKWTRKLRWEIIGREPFSQHELLDLSLKLKYGEAFAVASNNSDLIEGAHADQLLYIFDESKAIADETFDAAEGAFANAGAGSSAGHIEAYAISSSTPGEPHGRFYQIHRREPGFEDWEARHVTFEEVVKAGRASLEWGEQRKRQWGENSALYNNKVRGEFWANDEDGVIPLAWVELANERWLEWQDRVKANETAKGSLTDIGVDVALGGGDKTVFALRYEKNVIGELRVCPQGDTMQTTGLVSGILKANPLARANVDVIGIGAGVVHRLRELNLKVEPFNASERAEITGPYGKTKSATDSSGEMEFLNKRSHGWWRLRELLDPSGDGAAYVALPPDDELVGDLTAPRWTITSNGRIQVESKADIRLRLGRSTDKGDAVMQAFYPFPASIKVIRTIKQHSGGVW